MFDSPLAFIGVVLAAIGGGLIVRLVHLCQKHFDKKALHAYESEVTRSMAAARDRARGERDALSDRLARLQIEHAQCSAEPATAGNGNGDVANAIRVAQQERDSALTAAEVAAARADQLEQYVRALEGRDRGSVGDAPTWIAPGPNGRHDDLTAIRGLGKLLQTRLNGLGIFSYRQLARMTPENAKWIASRIHVVAGRIRRDRWAEQAREMHAHKYDDSV